MSVCFVFTLMLVPVAQTAAVKRLMTEVATAETQLKTALDHIDDDDEADKKSTTTKGRHQISIRSHRAPSRALSRRGTLNQHDVDRLAKIKSAYASRQQSRVQLAGGSVVASREGLTQSQLLTAAGRHGLASRAHSRLTPATYNRSLSRMPSAVNGRFNIGDLLNVTAAVYAAECIAAVARVKPDEFARPMYRTDALLSQYSVQHLPEYRGDMDEYRQRQIAYVYDCDAVVLRWGKRLLARLVVCVSRRRVCDDVSNTFVLLSTSKLRAEKAGAY